MEESRLHQLTEYQLEDIFAYLDVDSALNLCESDPKFAQNCQSQKWWKLLFERNFGKYSSIYDRMGLFDDFSSWKELCIFINDNILLKSPASLYVIKVIFDNTPQSRDPLFYDSVTSRLSNIPIFHADGFYVKMDTDVARMLAINLNIGMRRYATSSFIRGYVKDGKWYSTPVRASRTPIVAKIA